MKLWAAVRSAPFHFAAYVITLACVVGFFLPRHLRAGQDQVNNSQFRVFKILCGTKGELRGAKYVMDDQRTVFHVPKDHEIVIAFEWQGTPGTHHAVGTWRSPDGKVALTSNFELNSDTTFYVGTWTLAIPADIAPGLWALEAQVDGKPAGNQIFQIVSDEPAGPPPPPSPAEIYQRAAPATIFVTSLDQNGEPITRGLGFFVGDGSVLTAFQAIDGASSLRLDFADGSFAKVTDVVNWNRPQDWAILKVNEPTGKPLEQAAPNSWKVGDECYVVTSAGSNGRTIQTVNITGMEGTVPSAKRLTISAVSPEGWVGAPLLDRYGQLIGILGGVPAWNNRRTGGWMTYLEGTDVAVNPTVLPASEIPSAAISQQPTSLAELAAQGVLTTPLVINPQVASGVLSEDFRNSHGQVIVPVQPETTLSRAQAHLAVVITWGPAAKVRSVTQLRIYDSQNHALLQTTQSKIKLEPRVTTYSAWKIPIGSLQPGIYRIDLLLGGQPQWRSFFRLTQ